MSNVAEGAGMDDCRRPFNRLNQVRAQGILEQDRHGSGAAQVLSCHGMFIFGQTDHDPAETFPQIVKIDGKSQNRHYL